MGERGVMSAMMAGLCLGYLIASLVRPPLVEVHASTRSCSVPKTAGTLITARDDGWLFFEDSAGVIRAVDTDCKVKITINRD